jgi:hypothetical protein
MSRAGGRSPVSAVKQSAPRCHWSLCTVGAHSPSRHSGARGSQFMSGACVDGISCAGSAHCQPSSQTRSAGVTQTVSGESAP